MPATYEPIATTTISSQTSLTLSSIPGTYTDLRLIYVNTATNGNNNLNLRFNSDSASNYAYSEMRSDGSNQYASQSTAQTRFYPDQLYFMPQTSTSFFIFDFLGYSGTADYKTILYSTNEDIGASGNMTVGVSLWKNTAAISSIVLRPGTSTETMSGTATLFGILRA